VLVSTPSRAIMVEPMKMLFGVRAQVGPWNSVHILCGAQNPIPRSKAHFLREHIWACLQWIFLALGVSTCDGVCRYRYCSNCFDAFVAIFADCERRVYTSSHVRLVMFWFWPI